VQVRFPKTIKSYDDRASTIDVCLRGQSSDKKAKASKGLDHTLAFVSGQTRPDKYGCAVITGCRYIFSLNGNKQLTRFI